jgi:Cu2+-containing amine oxidase
MIRRYSANSQKARLNPLPAISKQLFRVSAGRLFVAVCWMAISSLGTAQEASVAHPLDPLSKEEIAAAVEVLKISSKHFSFFIFHL